MGTKFTCGKPPRELCPLQKGLVHFLYCAADVMPLHRLRPVGMAVLQVGRRDVEAI